MGCVRVWWKKNHLQETSGNAALVEVTLETLLRFLNWIPVGYIFETSLLENLVMKVRACIKESAL